MFLGRYEPMLEPDGRVALPPRFHDALQAGMIITRGTERCLYIFPLDTWDTLAARIDALPFGDADARNLRRAAFAAAQPAGLDAEGRVTVSDQLRAYARLEGPVAAVGMHSYIELWDLERWEALEAEVEAQSDHVAARLAAQF